ncbi:MAG: hypothetical protein QGG42_12770 [Phycisphaerae bacterium]|jgi:hypothetical protein|nr:hypothetical protein [Phycisphaerae bacterium]
MTAVSFISLLSTLGAVTVVFDVSFLALAVIGASIVVPLTGAMFLGVWCRMLNAPTPRYLRRCLAYGAAYGAALLVATLMMFLVKDSGKVPGWFLASLFGQALAIHALIVPAVLRTPWGKGIAAQALTLMLYGAVLVIAMAPVIIHVRKAVDRGEWTAELEMLYQRVTSNKGMDAGLLPETLAEAETAGGKILLLPGHERSDVVYLGDYIQENYRSLLEGLFVSSIAKIKGGQPETALLIWRDPESTSDYRLPVCSYDGTVSYLTRREFEHQLERTLLELQKLETRIPTTTTAPGEDPR